MFKQNDEVIIEELKTRAKCVECATALCSDKPHLALGTAHELMRAAGVNILQVAASNCAWPSKPSIFRDVVKHD